MVYLWAILVLLFVLSLPASLIALAFRKTRSKAKWIAPACGVGVVVSFIAFGITSDRDKAEQRAHELGYASADDQRVAENRVEEERRAIEQRAAEERHAAEQKAAEERRAADKKINEERRLADRKQREEADRRAAEERRKADAEAERALAELKAAEERKCSLDLKCVAEKALLDASIKCASAVERLAKNNFEWIDSWLEQKFSRYLGNKDNSVITYVGDRIKYQNGFGAWIISVYACEFDVKNNRVINAYAQPGRLPE